MGPWSGGSVSWSGVICLLSGLTPGQGTYVGYVFNPQLGQVWEATYLSLSLFLYHSPKSINTSWGEDLKQNRNFPEADCSLISLLTGKYI